MRLSVPSFVDELTQIAAVKTAVSQQWIQQRVQNYNPSAGSTPQA